MTHALLREPWTTARASPLILPRVIGATEVVILWFEVKLLAVPTADRSLLVGCAAGTHKKTANYRNKWGHR